MEEVLDAEIITEEVVAEDQAEADSQEDVKAEVLVDTEETQVAETVKVVAIEEILVVAIVKVVSTVKEEVVSDQELHQLVQAIEDQRHQILAIAEEEAKGVHHLKDVQQKEEVLALIVQKERQEDQMTNFLV